MHWSGRKYQLEAKAEGSTERKKPERSARDAAEGTAREFLREVELEAAASNGLRIFLIQRNQRPFYVDLQSTSNCRTFSIGAHTTVKVRLHLKKSYASAAIGACESQTSIHGTIPRKSEAHFRSHNVLWQCQTKSNESFLGEGFPPCFGLWWRCCQNSTHWAFFRHLRRCSDVLCRS